MLPDPWCQCGYRKSAHEDTACPTGPTCEPYGGNSVIHRGRFRESRTFNYGTSEEDLARSRALKVAKQRARRYK